MCGRATGASKATSPAICHLITILILRRRKTNMDLRNSISKPFKKLKRRIAEGSRKRKEGSGGDVNKKERKTNVEGTEAGQSSHLHPKAEAVAKSGPGRDDDDGEGEQVVQVNPPASTPSISHTDSGKPSSMWTTLPAVPSLIVSLVKTGTSAVPNPAQEALLPNKDEANTADENRSDWKSTASATAKLLLRGVRDSADAFGPLKAVTGGLCYILENCEVCSASHVYSRQRLRVFQRTKANKQAIESLAPRVKALSVSFCASVSEGDFKEQERREKLEQ